MKERRRVSISAMIVLEWWSFWKDYDGNQNRKRWQQSFFQRGRINLRISTVPLLLLTSLEAVQGFFRCHQKSSE
jgi:hypothetical protein